MIDFPVELSIVAIVSHTSRLLAKAASVPHALRMQRPFRKPHFASETPLWTKAMQSNKSVRYLDFSENSIGGGVERVMQPFVPGRTLGGAAVALALDMNSTLRRIDLKWNLLSAKVSCFKIMLVC